MTALKKQMKKAALVLVLLLAANSGWTDIGPNPIVLKSIMTDYKCEIQMVSETVDVELYNDSSFVSCTFNMFNHGDSLTLPVGFPVMNFFHWNMMPYDAADKSRFEIYVDNVKLGKNAIQVPERMKGVYDRYMKAVKADEIYRKKEDSLGRKYGSKNSAAHNRALTKISKWRDSQPYVDGDLMLEFDSLLYKGDYAWYIWNVKFSKGESKTIKVNYMAPGGTSKGAEYRYFKYLVSTGAGWKDKIEKAQINIKLHGIEAEYIETITPSNHKLDKIANTIKWTFVDMEPTEENDIYVRYYNPGERSDWERFLKKQQRSIRRANDN